MTFSLELSPLLPTDHDAVEHLLDLSFGPQRRTKTSYRLREGSEVAVGLVTRHPR